MRDTCVANRVFISGAHVLACTTSVAESTRMCWVGGGKLITSSSSVRGTLYDPVQSCVSTK